MKVKGRVVYERKSLLQISQLAKSAKARFLKSIQLKHWIMELEATIGTDKDFSKFPTPRKDGSYLTMEVDVSKKPIEWNLTRATIEGSAAAKLDNPDRKEK